MDDIPQELLVDFLEEIRDSFRVFDPNNTGKITLPQIEKVMNTCSLKPTLQELNEMKDILMQEDFIDFTQYTRIYADSKLNHPKQEQWREIFKAFDRNCDGYVGVSEIKFVLESMGVQVDRDEIQEMINQYNGEIGFQDFCRIFGKFEV
ncbi:Calmodulin [Spironucleus salmonicida]|uniref:Calmodulin n=1 Tax=Spironucleus salmonicida TaxID=348837 RepID=V6LPP9_9EUKA|nr:Calmodulin [Spironucleus salmonicida]|eukprot:EST46652.1 Calmodulin [Spironucleus salmonicida]